MIAARQGSLSITNSRSLLKLMPIESVMPSSHLILCHPLLLPPIPPSIRVFSNESTLRMRWPKYWCFSFSISPSNEHPGLISFRMDWLDLLAAQGILKSLLQHHSSKASIFWYSTFFTVQLSHPYMTTGKTKPRCHYHTLNPLNKGSRVGRAKHQCLGKLLMRIQYITKCVWVRVTSHPGFLRTERFPRMWDFSAYDEFMPGKPGWLITIVRQVVYKENKVNKLPHQKINIIFSKGKINKC